MPYQTTEITECTTPFCQMNPRVRMRRKEENKNLTRVSKFFIAQSETPKEEGGEKSAFRRVVRVTSSSSSRQKKLLNQEFLAAHDHARSSSVLLAPGSKKGHVQCNTMFLRPSLCNVLSSFSRVDLAFSSSFFPLALLRLRGRTVAFKNGLITSGACHASNLHLSNPSLAFGC